MAHAHAHVQPKAAVQPQSNGAFELRLRKKLLQQQIALVQHECTKLSESVARKQERRRARSSDEGGGSSSALRQGHAASNAYNTSDNAGACFPVTRYHKDATASELSRDRAAGPAAAAAVLPKPAPWKQGGGADQLHKKELMRHARRDVELQKRAAQERAERKAAAAAARERQGAATGWGPGSQDAKPAPSLFPGRYLRGEIPASVEHGGGIVNTLVWICPLQQLDYDHYLPVFFDGICCLEEPCRLLARRGALDLLEAARAEPERILPSVREIVKGVRQACLTRDAAALVYVCEVVSALTSLGPAVAAALVPHYRMFLGVLNLYYLRTRNLGDAMDYQQRTGGDVGERVQALCQLLERTGGRGAFATIKNCVPTCERG